MGHGHHHHVDPEAGDRRVFAAIAVNMGLTVAQIVGGIVSGSLALIADALHNFSDAISLIIAFGARKIARRPRDAEMTFGYGRVEVVAALINYTAEHDGRLMPFGTRENANADVQWWFGYETGGPGGGRRSAPAAVRR